MNDMDHASIGSTLNSTAVGPPASPASLLDGFRLRRGRMHGMKVVEQEEEGCLGAGGRRPSPAVESLAPITLIVTWRPRRLSADNDDVIVVAGDLPTTNRRERTRERESVWLRMGRRV
jgi:hypothetical protein